MMPGLVRRRGELDSARLATLAGRHLGLDHDRADFLREPGRLFGRAREPAPRDRDAVADQERLGRVLLEVHSVCSLVKGKTLLAADTRRYTQIHADTFRPEIPVKRHVFHERLSALICG